VIPTTFFLFLVRKTRCRREDQGVIVLRFFVFFLSNIAIFFFFSRYSTCCVDCPLFSSVAPEVPPLYVDSSGRKFSFFAVWARRVSLFHGKRWTVAHFFFSFFLLAIFFRGRAISRFFLVLCYTRLSRGGKTSMRFFLFWWMGRFLFFSVPLIVLILTLSLFCRFLAGAATECACSLIFFFLLFPPGLIEFA